MYKGKVEGRCTKGRLKEDIQREGSRKMYKGKVEGRYTKRRLKEDIQREG